METSPPPPTEEIRLDPDKLSTDEIPLPELKDICREISARNMGELTTPSQFATPNNECLRTYNDITRFEKRDDIAFAQNPFKEDLRRGLFSNAGERLQGKTQMCTLPSRDHITNRATHCARAAQIAASIARSLGANEDLAEAIMALHDIGHAPFGHRGEELITQAVIALGIEENRYLIGELGIFKHNIQGVNVVDRVAKRRGIADEGLNLTNHVRHGIIAHDGEVFKGVISPDRTITNIDQNIMEYMAAMIQSAKDNPFEVDPNDPEYLTNFRKHIEEKAKLVTITPATLEGCIAFMTDSLEYIPADFEDLLALNKTNRNLLPPFVVAALGDNGADMVNNLVIDLLINSYGKDQVGYSEEMAEVLQKFKREFMYPLYASVNSWAEADAKDSRVMMPEEAKDVRDRIVRLLKSCRDAAENPQKYSNHPIVSGFMKDRIMHIYYKKMRLIPTEMRSAQLAIDFISGCTDRYFLELIKNHT